MFSDLLHRFGCMTVLRGSSIFGVCFCDTGMGVARDDVAIKFWPCEGGVWWQNKRRNKKK